MQRSISSPNQQRLGRLCDLPERGLITPAASLPGLERIDARFFGEAFVPHRHDTYAIGVTLAGVQRFWYRGTVHFSTSGQVIVLHPDELHDGGAGTDECLRYRMLYLEPEVLQNSVGLKGATLPFVSSPVMNDTTLRRYLFDVLGDLNAAQEDLFVDEFLSNLAECLYRYAGRSVFQRKRLAFRHVDRAREYLRANIHRAVTSDELEGVSGLDRFTFSRQFRTLFGTSPHRYLVMRRVQRAKALIQEGAPLADIAASTGFADQSHLNRQFKKAIGMTPLEWRKLTYRL